MRMVSKLPFGLHNAKLVHISEVDSGLACECVCASCGQRLVAKKGVIKEHHFAHYNGIECRGAVETALHIFAKNTLERYKRIVLPPVYFGNVLIHDQTGIVFTKIFLEKRINDIIPDIIVYVKDKPLLIEIAVTHAVDVFKANRISNLGYSAIEINVAALFKATYNKLLFQKDFEKMLIEDIGYKRWINNVKLNASIFKMKKLAKNKEVIHSGLSAYPIIVNNCPLNKRIWKSGHKKGQSFASVFDDCGNCLFGEIRKQKKNFHNEETECGRILSVDCWAHINPKDHQKF